MNDMSIKKWNNKNLKWLCIFSAMGYIIYSTIAVNYLTNPDSSVFLVYKYAQEEGQLGRIGLKYVDGIFAKTVSPPLAVLGTVIFYSTGIVLISKMLEFEESNMALLLAGLFILLAPPTSSVITYHCFSIPYAVGYCMSIISVYLLVRFRGKAAVVISIILLADSLTLYQAYLPVAHRLGCNARFLQI